MDWITPAGADELAEAVRARAGDEGAPPVTGAAGPPDRLPDGARPPDAVLSTAGLSGVLEHRPRDLTVTVGAGTRVDDLLGRLDEAGGWLPFGGPARELSVGGAVACALPGPWDAGHGDLRRQLLACELVAWSGRRLRWGRGVMKNVAGYGTTRAVAGSFGRLGVVHRATLRLWPAPAERRVARLRPSPGGDALAAAGRIARSGFDAEVRPDAVVWRGSPGAGKGGDAGGGLEVRFVGSGASVELRLGRLRSWAADAGLGVDVGPAAGRPDAGDAADGPSTSGDGAGSAAGAFAAEGAASGPGSFGRRRAEAASAAWVDAGRQGFESAARSAREALGEALLGLGGYPLSGDVRCAWAAEGDGGSGGGPPGDRTPPAGGRAGEVRTGAAVRLMEALDGVPVRIERGRRAELEAAERRRDEGVRRLERRVVDALEGRPRRWLSGYL